MCVARPPLALRQTHTHLRPPMPKLKNTLLVPPWVPPWVGVAYTVGVAAGACRSLVPRCIPLTAFLRPRPSCSEQGAAEGVPPSGGKPAGRAGLQTGCAQPHTARQHGVLARPGRAACDRPPAISASRPAPLFVHGWRDQMRRCSCRGSCRATLSYDTGSLFSLSIASLPCPQGTSALTCRTCTSCLRRSSPAGFFGGARRRRALAPRCFARRGRRSCATPALHTQSGWQSTLGEAHSRTACSMHTILCLCLFHRRRT